jgi:CDP-paratose 2-epimerase
MKLLVTGGCGFTGHAVIRYLAERHAGLEVTVLDSLRRRGAEQNVVSLEMLGATVMHGDVRVASDFEGLDPVDWVIDCAAEPSVLAGTPAQRMTSKRQLVEHNLLGTLNILEFAARNSAGVVLLSTSPVLDTALDARRRFCAGRGA